MPRQRKPDPEKFCERCGLLMQRMRYGQTLEDLTRFKARRFCSLHCANSRGVRSQSSSSQHRISAKSVKPQCESCGAKRHLHVHHKNGDWRDHKPDNLQTLCIRCHLGDAHKKPEKLCSVCGKKSRRLGMCQKHYQRAKKYGNPLLTKRRKPGTANEFETVSEC